MLNSEFVHFTRTALTHLCQMEFPSAINWRSPFVSRDVRLYFFIFIQILIENYASKQWRPRSEAKSADPDQMPHSLASDLGLHYLPMSHKKDAKHIWVKKCNYFAIS